MYRSARTIILIHLIMPIVSVALVWWLFVALFSYFGFPTTPLIIWASLPVVLLTHGETTRKQLIADYHGNQAWWAMKIIHGVILGLYVGFARVVAQMHGSLMIGVGSGLLMYAFVLVMHYKPWKKKVNG